MGIPHFCSGDAMSGSSYTDPGYTISLLELAEEWVDAERARADAAEARARQAEQELKAVRGRAEIIIYQLRIDLAELRQAKTQTGTVCWAYRTRP